jgi:tetratricopeptide (TPR) repeat protein
MLQLARPGGRFRSLQTFVFAVPGVAFLLGLSLSIAPPLRAQNPPQPTFEEVEKQATEEREEKRLDDAVALYREGLKLKPGWQEGSWYLGTSLYGLKRYPEARDAFRHVALSQPGNGAAWALAGMCEFELKNYPRALEYLLRSESAGVVGNEELSSLVRFRIALLLNRAGQTKQAMDRLIPIATAGTYPEVIEALGLNLLRAPLLPTEIPEQDRDLYMRAGEASNAYLTHDSEAAGRLFEELVAAYPDRPNVHLARGAFLTQSDPEKAMLEFQRELELNPSQSDALLELTKLSLKQGSTENALSYARRAVKAAPAVPAAHLGLGEALLESGDTSGAIDELQTAVRQEPEFPQSHFLLAETYRKAGNKLSASKEMAEFQRLDKKQKSAFSSATPPQ